MKNYDEIIKSANDTMMQLHQNILELHEEIERLKKEEEIMKVDFREQDNGLILETSQKMFTKILDVQEQETIKAALKYCEENDELQDRIDKAIEYLYENSQYNDGDGIHYIKEDEYCVDYLLDILKESENNE